MSSWSQCYRKLSHPFHSHYREFTLLFHFHSAGNCHLYLCCREMSHPFHYCITGNSYTHLTEAEGTVEYKDYCDHGLCVWNVSVNNGSVLQVATESFSMICNSDFTGIDCDCATLMIYDGTSISNKSLLTRSQVFAILFCNMVELIYLYNTLMPTICLRLS